MNTKRPVLALILLAFLSLTPALSAQKTVGVLDISPKTGVSAAEADIVTDFVYDALYRFGGGTYMIISRQNREAILAEHKFTLSGLCDDASCALEVGKYLAADYVIIGSFARFGSKYYLSLQLVDVNTTAVSGSSREGAETLDGIADTAVDACVRGVFNAPGMAGQGGSSGGAAGAATSSAAGTASPTAVSLPAELPRNMVLVEGGTFRMGSASGGNDNESPVHDVTVSTFYISRYEVTQALYREVMGSSPSAADRGIGDSHPVNKVSWYDAVKFCNRLSERDGLKPAYTINGASVSCDWSADGYRLPTEAEWEYAARGGKKSGGYAYAGSGSPGDVAWYKDNCGETSHPVGQKKPNELGLYDMSGNVHEWCWDFYGRYTGGSQRDPRGPASASLHMLRGGSWFSFAGGCRVTDRGGYYPGDRAGSIGFRIVRNPCPFVMFRWRKARASDS